MIATGVTTTEAVTAVGVSVPVGARWFRHAGGMPPISLAEPGRRYLSLAEREEIAILRATGQGVRAIARATGRDPGTISRELRRNAATRGGKVEYRATVAQWKAQEAAKRPKTAKLVTDPRLRDYVQDRLAGSVTRPDGTAVKGPDTPAWKGLNKPHRADRRWSKAWSPEQISNRLKLDFPDDESMRVSHETIYQSLFIEGRGALKRELGDLSADRTSLAAAKGTFPQRTRRACDSRCRDQQATRRGRRPGGPRALGRRPDHRDGQISHRYLGRTPQPRHDPGPPAQTGRPR